MMEEQKKNERFTLAELLNGRVLERELFVRNKVLLFVIFLMLLANITVRYKTAKVLREVDATALEVKELRAHSIAVASDVIKLTRPSEILDRIKNSNLDLETSKVPPRRIYVDKEGSDGKDLADLVDLVDGEDLVVGVEGESGEKRLSNRSQFLG